MTRPTADLTIHGRLAGVLASTKASEGYSTGLRKRHANPFARRVRAGELKDRVEKLA